MMTRTIPSTNEKIPVIGMGTWQTFDEDPADAEAMTRLSDVLKTFHAGGGRVIDSSPMYGRSETVTGTLSSKLNLNSDFFMATKVWTRGREAGVAQMNDSITKLGRQKIELMQIHNLLDVAAHLPVLHEMKAGGRIKYIGVTHYQQNAFDDLERIIRAEKIDFVQLPFSVDAPEAQKRLIPAARDSGVAILVMRPFGGGELFGRVRGKPLPDHVKAYADSWAQAFLKFILAEEAVTATLPATRKPHHMADNLRAGAGRLPTAQERQQLTVAVVG